MDRFSRDETVRILFPVLVGTAALMVGHWVIALVALLLSAAMALGIILTRGEVSRNFYRTELPEGIIEQEEGLGYHVVFSNEATEMRSGDIPNGFIVSTADGKPALIDFDESGKALPEEYTELFDFENWIDEILVGGRFPSDAFILVHSVKGSGRMLIRSLERSRMTLHGDPISAENAGVMGVLFGFAETVRKNYIRKLEEQCESTVENTDACS